MLNNFHKEVAKVFFRVKNNHFFGSFFKAEKRMSSFYKLLVKESLDREDVEAMEKENIKDCHEIVQGQIGQSTSSMLQQLMN